MEKYSYLYVALSALLLISPVKAGCPSTCTCSSDFINCSRASLEAVPYFESTDVHPGVIDLSENEIINIGSTDLSFDGSSSVQVVYLNDNSLLDVNEKAFLEMPDLQEVYLNRNLLEGVPDNLIDGNENLVLLDLSGNYFSENTPSLHSQSLEILDLSSSKISSFTEDNIKYLPNLKVLNLRFNNIRYIDSSIFQNRSLLGVDVYYNIWECSSKTIELFDFLVTKNLTEIKEPIRCAHDDGSYSDIYTKEGPVPEQEYLQSPQFDSQVIEDSRDGFIPDTNADQGISEDTYDEISFGGLDDEKLDLPSEDDLIPSGNNNAVDSPSDNVDDEDNNTDILRAILSDSNDNENNINTNEEPLKEVLQESLAQPTANDSTANIIINEEVNIIMFGSENDPPMEREFYRFYFTDNLIVLIGVSAFILTFMSGIIIGFYAISNRSFARMRSRRDINASTNTLISKLTDDIA